MALEQPPLAPELHRLGGRWYLYFTASTNLGPAFSFAEMSNFPHQSSRSVYAVVLRKELASPLSPDTNEITMSACRSWGRMNCAESGSRRSSSAEIMPPKARICFLASAC